MSNLVEVPDLDEKLKRKVTWKVEDCDSSFYSQSEFETSGRKRSYHRNLSKSQILISLFYQINIDIDIE